MRRGRPPLPSYRKTRGGPYLEGAPWPRTELLARLEAWAVGRAADYPAWLAGDVEPDDAIGAAILALPLLWRAVVLARFVAGQTVADAAATIGAHHNTLGEHYLRALSVIHGYLLATDTAYRELARAHDLTNTAFAYRPDRAGPVGPAAEQPADADRPRRPGRQRQGQRRRAPR